MIEDDSINALALPGGFVFINTGILLTADEEAEVAGVMAHEIAHVTARHGTENATKGQIINLASIPLIFLGGVAGFGIRQAAGFAIPMQFMSFSRGAEEEADYLGSQYAYKTGYDPGAAVTFFEKIQARETAKPGTISSLFRSHPPTEDRIKKTKGNIALVLPERDQYVLTTSEFLDVQERLIAYENRQPDADEEESNRPSLRHGHLVRTRTQRLRRFLQKKTSVQSSSAGMTIQTAYRKKMRGGTAATSPPINLSHSNSSKGGPARPPFLFPTAIDTKPTDRVSSPSVYGVVVQLVRTPACHAGGREFESRRPRLKTAT